ncbi:Conserved oligomeric Golgi complex subunit 2-like protein [Drosera capensis]
MTNLVDVEGFVVRMRAPVVELRGKVEELRGGLEGELVKVREREEVARAREVVKLLLVTFHVVSKVEKLIKELPSVPEYLSNGETGATDQSHLSNGISQPGERGSNARETQSMLLERIASEMNRLKFYIARAKYLPSVQNMEKRIHSASHVLDSSLGRYFVDGLQHRDETAIYNCLRAHAALDNTSSTEEIFRTTILAPLVGKELKHSPSELAAETSGNELQQNYQLIKQYVENNFKFLQEISSRGTFIMVHMVLGRHCLACLVKVASQLSCSFKFLKGIERSHTGLKT